MSATVNTPTVIVRLDDSERIRLEKLRNRLKLNHWSKISPSYQLYPDVDVAKKIQDLEVSDPVKHDEKYSYWSNRYSDLDMQWQKTRDPTTSIIYGTLVASGKMRFRGLGQISSGCSITVMRGKMNNEPLPSTKVGPLRVTHLNLTIDFPVPTMIENPDHDFNQSTSFRVGKDNALYGTTARKDNLFTF